MADVLLRKYGEAATINFDLFEVDGVDFRVDAVHATGDSVIMKDEGTEANTTNAFTDEGTGYSLVLTATEMQAARIKIYLIDQTATKVWLDKSITIETYGNASAQHAFDLDTASTAQTGDSYARIGAAGASLTAVPWNASWDAEVQSECTDALNAYDPPTNTEMTSAFTEIKGATWASGTDTLEAIRDRGDAAWTTGSGAEESKIATGTAQSVTGTTIVLAAAETFADDELIGATVVITGGSTGVGQSRIITDYVGSTDTATVDTWTTTPTGTITYAVYATPPSSTTSPAAVNAIQISGSATAANNAETCFTGTITTLDALDTAQDTQHAATLTRLGTPAGADIAADLATIVADTNELQTDWANAGRLDTILDARAAQTTVDAIETDTQDIQSRLPAALVGGRMDSDVEAINNNTAAADNLQASALGLVSTTVNDASASTTSFVTALTEATDDHYNGRVIVFTSGDLAGQATDITDYNGTTKAVTVTALTEAPANGVSFVIV